MRDSGFGQGTPGSDAMWSVVCLTQLLTGDPDGPMSPLSPLGPEKPMGPPSPLGPSGPAGPAGPGSPDFPRGPCKHTRS